MNLKTNAIAGVRATAFAMACRAALGLAQLAILARILSLEDFGLAALSVSLITSILTVADMGVSTAIVHFKHVTDEERSTLFWLNVVTGVGLAIGAVLLSSLVSKFYSSPAVAPVLVATSTLLVIVAFGQQIRTVAEKEMRFNEIARIEVAAAISGFLVAVCMAFAGAGVYSIVAGLLASSTCSAALAWVFLSGGWRPQRHFRWTDARRFVRFGSHLTVGNLSNALAMQADILASGRFFSGPVVGLYSQPRDLCFRIMFTTNPIATRVGLPLIASAQHDLALVAKLYLNVLRMTASVNFPIYAAIALFSSDVVQVVLGGGWEHAADLLLPIALWCMARSVANPVGMLLLGTGHSRRSMIASVLVMLAVAVASVIGARFGIAGIPTALAVLYALLIPVFWLFFVRPICGAGFIEYHRQLVVPFAITLFATFVAGLAAMPFEGAVMKLGAGGVLGGLGYIVVSRFLNRSWYDAMRQMLVGVG